MLNSSERLASIAAKRSSHAKQSVWRKFSAGCGAAAIALACALSANPASAQDKPKVPTIEDLAAFPQMSNISIAPDGKHIVAIQARGEDRVILVFDATDLNKAPNVISSDKMKVRSVSFVKPDLLAVALWQPLDTTIGEPIKTFANKLYITDLQGKNWSEPVPPETSKDERYQQIAEMQAATIIDTLPSDPDKILVMSGASDSGGDIFRANLRKKGDFERVQRTDEDTFGYIADNKGDIRVRLKMKTGDNDGTVIITEIRDPATNSWSEHFKTRVKDRSQKQVIGFSPDNNIAYVRSNEDGDKAAIYEYDIAQRKIVDTLFKHKYFDAIDVITYPYADNALYKQGQLLGVVYNGPQEDDVFWIDPAQIDLDKKMRAAFGIKQTPLKIVDPATGESSTIQYDNDLRLDRVSATPDYKTMVYRTSASNQPPIYYMVNDGKISKLSSSFPQIDPKALGHTELIYYTARDGQPIPAFLTKPSEALCGAGPWPAVVHPHGGPWARDNMDFDGSMWIPLMSSRCMAVLQPQYRGSEGWGRKLWTAGDAEWGQKMQDDKDDGAKWLVEQKIAIPGRTAMFGFSYGGYASMAAAVRPEGNYKCAISGAGVSNIKKIWASFYDNPYFRDAQRETVKGLSPSEKADQIKIPIMVYQGERDQTVPVEQADMFMAGAKKSGQPVEYHLLKDYAHGPAWTRKIMADQLRLIDDYFKTGCGGGGL